MTLAEGTMKVRVYILQLSLHHPVLHLSCIESLGDLTQSKISLYREMGGMNWETGIDIYILLCIK